MKRVSLCGFLILVITVTVVAQVSDGSIQGSVTDVGGKAVSGAFVVATPQGSSGGATLTTTTGTSGAFSFPHAQPGIYLVCVQTPGTTYLNPCHWSATPTVTVAAGKVGSSNIQLAKGAVLHVRVNDPDQHVAKGDGNFVVGVRGPSLLFHPLVQSSNDPGGMSFDVAIPLATALKLEISSDHLQFADQNGVALPSVVPAVLLQQTAGQPDPFVTFNITGKK